MSSVSSPCSIRFLLALTLPHWMHLCDGADSSLSAVPLYDSLGESAVEVGAADRTNMPCYLCSLCRPRLTEVEPVTCRCTLMQYTVNHSETSIVFIEASKFAPLSKAIPKIKGNVSTVVYWGSASASDVDSVRKEVSFRPYMEVGRQGDCKFFTEALPWAGCDSPLLARLHEAGRGKSHRAIAPKGFRPSHYHVHFRHNRCSCSPVRITRVHQFSSTKYIGLMWSRVRPHDT